MFRIFDDLFVKGVKNFLKQKLIIRQKQPFCLKKRETNVLVNVFQAQMSITR